MSTNYVTTYRRCPRCGESKPFKIWSSPKGVVRGYQAQKICGDCQLEQQTTGQ